jgi:hypothetical protein
MALFWLPLILVSVVGCSHSRKLEFNDFFSTHRSHLRARDASIQGASMEILLLIEIQKSLDQRKFNQSLKLAHTFQKNYPVSQYTLWVKVMEGLGLEGIGSFDQALSCFQSVIESTAGDGASSISQIQTFALFHRGRIQIIKNENEKGLASYLDAFKQKNLLPRFVYEVELPLEIARTYSLLGEENTATEFELLSAQGFKSFLKDERLNSDQKGSIFLRLGWRENFGVPDLKSSRLMQADQQKNLYLLAAIQTEVDPYAKLAASNLINVLSKLKTPLEQEEPLAIEARNEFRQKKRIYGGDLADLFREISLQLRPSPLRGPREKEFALFLDSSQTVLMSLLKKTSTPNELTPESEKRNSLKREFRSFRFMPLFNKEDSKDSKIQPSLDPNL